MNKIHLLVILLFAFGFSSKAQNNLHDSSLFIPSLGINYTYQFVGGDLKNTFGNSHSIGANLNFKLKNNWLFGGDFQFYFSDQIKNKEPYFQNIVNNDGYIIDGDGQYAEVYLYQRGFNTQLYVGYQFNLWAKNPNSGPFIQFGMGFMQYWVRIENPGLTAPQITGDYKKMYDRLTNGLSTSQFIGYRWMGNRNLTNFYFGIELTQGWTENRRNYNADLSPEDLGKHLDLLTGIKVGWIIPFYPKVAKEYYYY